jgi:hypothetical protein
MQGVLTLRLSPDESLLDDMATQCGSLNKPDLYLGVVI